MVDLDELEALARAVPYPNWSAKIRHGNWSVYAEDPGDVPWFLCEMAEEITRDETGEKAARFIAAASPAVVLELIQMARTGYARALRDVKQGMEVARAVGLKPDCGHGCTDAVVTPGCPVHDPTAPLSLGSGYAGSGM